MHFSHTAVPDYHIPVLQIGRSKRWNAVCLGIAVVGFTTFAAHAELVINEILFNPPTDVPNEYIELRGTPNLILPAGTHRWPSKAMPVGIPE